MEDYADDTLADTSDGHADDLDDLDEIEGDIDALGIDEEAAEEAALDIPDDAAAADEEERDADEDTVMRPLIEYRTEVEVLAAAARRTSNILTRNEITELTGIRATDIAANNNCMVPIGDLDDPISQARREIMMRQCPLVLRRAVGESIDHSRRVIVVKYEDWDVNTMTFPVAWKT